jgi:hypothetical protein
MKQTLLAVVALSAFALACDEGSGPMTGPDAANQAAQTAQRYAVRTNGERVPAPRMKLISRPSRGRLSGGDFTTAAITVCDGELSGGPYDNVEVPAGKECTLSGVSVTQSVRAFAKSQLFIFSSNIGGSVVARGSDVVQLEDETTIGGNVDVLGGGDINVDLASCSVNNVTIQGNLSCVGQNPGSPVINRFDPETNEDGTVGPDAPVSVGGNVLLALNRMPANHVLNLLRVTIGGNANVLLNVGVGSKIVHFNVVTGRLACVFNTPPFTGGPNTAATKIGQCF